MAEIEYQSIDPVTVYAASGVAPGSGPEHVGPVVGQLLPPLQAALSAAGVDFREPGIFWYEMLPGGSQRVWVSWVAGGDPVPSDAWQIIELPAVPRAACLTHHGDMAGIGEAWHRLMSGIEAAGESFTAPGREVYLVSEGPQSEWITQIQQPVA